MPTPTRSAPPTLVSGRRAVLGLAAGATAALAGCTGDDGQGAPTPTLPPEDADADLVAEVTTALAAQRALVHGVLTDFPALKGDLQPFRRLHRLHLEALGGHDDELETPGRPGGDRKAVRHRVLRSEEQLQRRLVKAAVDAESGALAKLLASMSAAIAQHLAVTR